MDHPSERFWDSVWDNDQNHDFWKQVDPEIVDLIQSQSPAHHPTVLDLGCGLGRNAVAFAQAGFDVMATDISSTATTHLQHWCEQLNLTIRTAVCDFTEDIFLPASFDIVISVNVLYHGYREQLVQGVQHVRRWLKPGGLFYFTCPTREDGEYGMGKVLAPHTFELEPGHQHYCADKIDLDDFLVGFEFLFRKRREHEWEKEGVPCFSSRWQVLVKKP